MDESTVADLLAADTSRPTETNYRREVERKRLLREAIRHDLEKGELSKAQIAAKHGVRQEYVQELSRPPRNQNRTRTRVEINAPDDTPLVLEAEGALRKAKANVMIAEARVLEAKAQELRARAKQLL